MRTLLLKLAAFSAVSLRAQGQPYTPPDFYNDPLPENAGMTYNAGQIADQYGDPTQVVYYTEGGRATMYMLRNSIMAFKLVTRDTLIATPDTVRTLHMRFAGETAGLVDPIAYLVRGLKQSFYMAHCSVNGVESFYRVIYENVYPFIDVHVYHGLYGEKIAIVMRPGADPSDLLLEFEGQDSLNVDVQGTLRIYLEHQWIELREAVAYQVDGNNTVVPVNWNADYEEQSGVGQVSFNYSSYNTAWPLVFQIGPPPAAGGGYDLPGLCWSTLFGGDGQDQIRTSTKDSNDNLYVAGSTGSDFMLFPPAPGTLLAGSGEAAFLCQLDAQDQVQWKLFIGGSLANENSTATGVAMHEGAGPPTIYLAGTTGSSVFNVLANGAAYYDNVPGPPLTGKGFLGRFEVNNNGFRLWSTYFGGENLQIQGLRRSSTGYLYVVGLAYNDLPPEQDTPPASAIHHAYGGNGDAFICRLNPDDRTDWCTYMGGSLYDWAVEVVNDEVSGTVIVAGRTYSTDLQPYDPGGGAYQMPHFGGSDAFLFEYSLEGAPIWSTYIGTNNDEVAGINALAIDPASGDLVIGGRSDFHTGLDVVEGPNWYNDAPATGTEPAFLARFSGVNRGIEWLTYVPNNNQMDIYCMLFDALGNLFVASHSTGTGAPYVALAGAYDQPIINPDYLGSASVMNDMHIMCFTPEQFLIYASYFGGVGFAIAGDAPWSMVMRFGQLYVSGVARMEFPYTAYFPLDDGMATGGTPYFEPMYQGPSGDGFIAAFCGDVFTAVEVPYQGAATWSAQSSGANSWLINGLPQGMHLLHMHDSRGRLVQRASVCGNAPVYWNTAALVPGIYLLSAPGVGTLKLPVQ